MIFPFNQIELRMRQYNIYTYYINRYYASELRIIRMKSTKMNSEEWKEYEKKNYFMIYNTSCQFVILTVHLSRNNFVVFVSEFMSLMDLLLILLCNYVVMVWRNDGSSLGSLIEILGRVLNVIIIGARGRIMSFPLQWKNFLEYKRAPCNLFNYGIIVMLLFKHKG